MKPIGDSESRARQGALWIGALEVLGPWREDTFRVPPTSAANGGLNVALLLLVVLDIPG
jgi:hypothetical protein